MRAGLLGLAVLALAGCGGTTTITVTSTVTHTRTVTVTRPATTTTAPAASAACTAGNLQGSFDGVQGSAGAGQIVYQLKLTNTGASPCFVTGIPQVQLLGTTGNGLPTNASPEPGQPAAAKVSLAHGASATADAQFSPDVPGTGDSTSGRCQPTATVLRVTATGGGTLDAPIQPPTSVCEQGSMRFKPLVAASP
ncbi:MAG: DUF4232 domain-containing protein [Acidobacteriota bacterium]|nr:DUF4232 domain-containing protein [Acidobacteriota bacterium]